MIAKRVPRQFRNHAMILMCVLAVMGQNQIWRCFFQSLKEILDFFPFERKEAVPKIFDDDFPLLGLLQKQLCAIAGFALAFFAGTENDPNDLQILVGRKQSQYGPAAADLNIV